MKKLISAFTEKNMSIGYLYFYIHFVTEVICFYVLARVIGNSVIAWMIPFLYDALAFVPQSLIGYVNDKYRKINFSLIGLGLLLFGFISFMINLFPSVYIPMTILCLGNASLHVRGAELTLRNSGGKLSHSAVFVSGGSFGVITGKLLGKSLIAFPILVILGLSTIPFILLAEEHNDYKNDCSKFNYVNKKINPGLVVFLAVFIVIVRGYMGYGIPTSWNKTVFQTILLFSMMGVGKAMGGILSDAFGIKKVAVLSMLLSIPFLICGDNLMIVSLIGVFFFSMTMSITLAVLTSVLKKTPGLAFGLTTIGLFLGTVPIFFVKIANLFVSGAMIVVTTLICVIISLVIIEGDRSG
jgi:hypothetical protein